MTDILTSARRVRTEGPAMDTITPPWCAFWVRHGEVMPLSPSHEGYERSTGRSLGWSSRMPRPKPWRRTSATLQAGTPPPHAHTAPSPCTAPSRPTLLACQLTAYNRAALHQDPTVMPGLSYCRKSTEAEDRQVISMLAVTELQQVAARLHLHIVEILTEPARPKSRDGRCSMP